MSTCNLCRQRISCSRKNCAYKGINAHDLTCKAKKLVEQQFELAPKDTDTNYYQEIEDRQMMNDVDEIEVELNKSIVSDS